jgi:hypothetical protein
VRRWTKRCVSDGSMECARALTRPPINSASLREGLRAFDRKRLVDGDWRR